MIKGKREAKEFQLFDHVEELYNPVLLWKDFQLHSPIFPHTLQIGEASYSVLHTVGALCAGHYNLIG